MLAKTFHLSDTRPLVDCAMGRKPADLVIRNGRWVSVQTGEIIPGTDVAILDERIAYVGPDASHTIGPKTHVVEANNRYMSPGFLDGHLHIDSAMLTITEFVRAVVAHGSTGLFVDPHEIANVLGMEGVKLMVNEAAVQPIHVFVQMPSCVPSAPGLETPGATFSPQDVEEAMKWDGIIGLGEVMNFPGVIASEEKIHAEMTFTRRAWGIVGGHYASADLGLPFHGYVAGGATDDHEGTRLEDAVVRARQGMRVMMRFGSAWHDVAAQVRAITELGLENRYFVLCTDDSHAETLMSDGHIDRVLRHAIAHGLPPIQAIQMATINTAEYFGLSQDMGMIAPGRYADIVLLEDLVHIRPSLVIAKGKVAAENGLVVCDLPSVPHPEWALHTVIQPRRLQAADFHLSAPKGQKVIAHVIGILENQALDRHLRMEMPVANGEVLADPERDIAKLALVERHKGTGRIQYGLVHGLGLLPGCAVATTVAHDCHQMIVVGNDDKLMAQAANTLTDVGGGQIVIKDGSVLGMVPLPIAGLMSDRPVAEVAEQVAALLAGYQDCGCMLNNPNMQVSLLALVVIPDLRISDLGLVDVNRFDFISLFDQV
jgi:adenine deaminase